MGSQSSDSLYNDSHTARALMMNRMLFWKAVSGLAHSIKLPNEADEIDVK